MNETTNTLNQVAGFSKKRKKQRHTLPSVEIKNLVIDFGETLAVDNINFKIEKGELVTLLGPSGCGKTTTLNAIAGLLTPTSGEILFNGQNVTKLSPQKRKLGLVFQNYALYPHMSVYKNIAFPLTNDELWKWSVKKRNIAAKNEIEVIKLKSAGAKDSDIKELNKKSQVMLDIVAEVNSYLKELNAEKNKEVIIAKNDISLLRAKSASDIAKLNKKALDEIISLEQKNKNEIFIMKSKAASNAELKKEVRTKAKELKSNLVSFSKSKRSEVAERTKEIKSNFSSDIKEAKNNFKELKQSVSESQKENSRNIKEAKSNKRKLPKQAGVEYKAFLSELKKKYQGTELNEKDQKKIDELSERIISYKTAIHNAVMEVATKVDIVKNLKKKPTKLSGGQQQRVAIARGIAKKPQILLMDEPLSNLDAKLRISTREWIKSIVTDLGMTTIFVTHDQEEAMSISDKIICMSNGEVQQVGSPIELYNNPRNSFVAQFLGMPEMKMFNANVSPSGIISIGKTKLANSKKVSGMKTVQLGIRAEHIKEGKANSLAATIKSVEYLGKEILATVKYSEQGTGKVFLSKKDKYEVGEVVNLQFPEKYIHLFDKEGRKI